MADFTRIVKDLTDRSGNSFFYQSDKWFGCYLLL